jgi:isopenicillin N synthase-like dioxygenase
MTNAPATPRVDIAALFGPDSVERAAADRALMAAITRFGYVTVAGMPAAMPLDAATRRTLLSLLTAPEAEGWRQRRQARDGQRSNVYRGWFTLQDGHSFGLSIGPDVVRGAGCVDPADPLRAATPLPPEEKLPGWRAVVRDYYRAMERIGAALIAGIARGLGLPEAEMLPVFAQGISTLRLMRYPLRPASALAAIPADRLYIDHEGARRLVILDTHADFGILALVAQDGIGGLQIRTNEGGWVDVAPEEGTLAVTFGRLLERWTGGRIRATRHRVLSTGSERFSLPFFYEPAAAAEIAPLPLPGGENLAPFRFGDYVWANSKIFTGQRGGVAAGSGRK